MNILFYFRHMDSSDALKFDFTRKAEGMESLIQASKPVHVTFTVENNLYKVHVGLHARSHNAIEVEETTDDMHKSIDMVVDILKRQLTKIKGKQVRHASHADPFVPADAAAAAVAGEIDPLDDVDDYEFEKAPSVPDLIEANQR